MKDVQAEGEVYHSKANIQHFQTTRCSIFPFFWFVFAHLNRDPVDKKSMRIRIHNVAVSELVIQQKLRQKICDSSVPGLINWQTLTNDFYSPPVTVSANM
jgi:hypothetical protein